jgi:integrase
MLGLTSGNGMARQINRLNARQVQTLTMPGRHADGGGLYLVVSKPAAKASKKAQGAKPGAKRGKVPAAKKAALEVKSAPAKKWVFLYRRRRDGKLCEMGLGGLAAVSLAKARDKAAAARAMLAEGKDPLEARQDGDEEVPTFGAMADQVIASLEAGWRNEKHRAQWRMTLQAYAGPLRTKPVDEITTEDVLAILQPIWTTKAETASRVRGRIEKVLDAAKAKGLRTGENPARWRGHLDHLLPKRQKLQRGHHPAMPWTEVPAFIGRLREQQSVGALALEFVVLTACRSGEVLRSVRNGEIMGARWEEIDRGAKVWTVPAVRMKTSREHRVPLSGRALAILDHLEKGRRGPFIFPGQRGDVPLSDMALEVLMRRMEVKPYTVHGFRSSFRDWAGECTSFPREIAEAALAHAVGDQTERAYRRGDALERRRELMQAWANFCEPKTVGNVIALAAAARAAP